MKMHVPSWQLATLALQVYNMHLMSWPKELLNLKLMIFVAIFTCQLLPTYNF